MNLSSNKRIAVLAVVVFALDQLSKLGIIKYFGFGEEKVLLDGFFKLVYWLNTGAAWSMFRDNNQMLAIVDLLALLILFLVRHRFETHTTLGWVSLGLLFGGITGNLLDRLLPARQAVIDFIYFYIRRSGGREIGFPAFNVADSAICIGVALLFFLSLQKEKASAAQARAGAGNSTADRESPIADEAAQ